MTPSEFWESTPAEVSIFVLSQREHETNAQEFDAHLTACMLSAWSGKRVTAAKVLGRPTISLKDFGSIKEAKKFAIENQDNLGFRR